MEIHTQKISWHFSQNKIIIPLMNFNDKIIRAWLFVGENVYEKIMNDQTMSADVEMQIVAWGPFDRQIFKHFSMFLLSLFYWMSSSAHKTKSVDSIFFPFFCYNLINRNKNSSFAKRWCNICVLNFVNSKSIFQMELVQIGKLFSKTI